MTHMVRGAPGAQPGLLDAAAVPAAGGETEYFAGHTDLVERTHHHIDQRGHCLDVLAHGTRAVDQKTHCGVGLRSELLLLEQPALRGGSDQATELAAVDVTLFLAAQPTVALRRGEHCLKLARQTRLLDRLLCDALIHALAVFVE